MPLPEPGTLAPAFELTGHNGQLLRLADLAGQRVLLWFFSRAFGSN